MDSFTQGSVRSWMAMGKASVALPAVVLMAPSTRALYPTYHHHATWRSRKMELSPSSSAGSGSRAADGCDGVR